MIIRDEYLLRKLDVPIIDQNKNVDRVSDKVTSDPGVGGLRLVYRVRRFHIKEFRLLGYKVPVPWGVKVANFKRVFLRPFKHEWDTRKNKLKPNYWGKREDPLTNMWLEMPLDYSPEQYADLTHRPAPKAQIKNHEFIKFLNKRIPEFTIQGGKISISV